VQKERTKGEDVASVGLADDGSFLRVGRDGPFVGEPTHGLGARQYDQRAILRIGAIQMQAQGQHALQNSYGRLDVGSALLDRPGAETVPAESLADPGSAVVN